MSADEYEVPVRGRMPIRAESSAPEPALDDLDKGIIQMLRENGRATNLEIGSALGVTAATVSLRIKRLEDSRAMKVVAVSDFSAHGYDILLTIGIKVAGRDREDVGAEIAALPEVYSIHMMNGRFDLEAFVVLKNFEEVGAFMAERMAGIEGVAEMDSAVVYDIVKFEFNVAPL